MKQVLRKGLKDIVVEHVPDPVSQPHHVLIRPAYSLISSGTETASLHSEGVISAVRHNPSHLQKIAGAVKSTGPVRTFAEVKAKFSEYAVLGYSGAGVVAEAHPSVTDLVKAITEVDPQKPSDVFASTDPDKEAVTEKRGASSERLRRQVKVLQPI